MAANRLGAAGLVAAGAAGAFLLAGPVEGHCHQQFPISRQYSWSRDFYDHKFENLEEAPYAFNAGGVKVVKDRAKAKTNAAMLESAGGGDLFPLYFLDLADNGNYLETAEVAKRTTPCGDPRLGFDEDEITYSTPNSQWEVLHTFEGGQEIEIDVVIVYYHWGHMEFFLCDTGDMANPDGVVDQECFNKYPLTRAYNADDASPIDPIFPGRYYVDPPCRAGEVAQNVTDNFPDGAYNVKMRYTLPDIECEHCVLQMHYLTGHRCKHIGYDDFDPPSWNSDCAPSTDEWIYTDKRICGEAHAYPEEFWQCSDIALTRAERTVPETSAPVTPKTPAPATPESIATPAPVGAEPLNEEMPVTTVPVDEAGTCSNGVRGVESEGACCVLECGTCGGAGCSTVSESLGLGAADCCETVILENDEPCGEAPCVIEGASTTTSSETWYPPSSDTETYTDGTGVNSEHVPEDIPGTFEHLGCFKDSKEDRVLHRGEFDSPEMTADVCFEYCSMRGAAYMATQYSYECWCSRDGMLDYERHGQGAVCDYPCIGDENEICGGYDSFDLFKLWWPSEPEDPEYVGCYHDDKRDRVLSHKVTIPGMTTAVCREHCSGKGALFYATQYATECWCGTSDIEADYERHGPGNCYMGCGGEEGVACGGWYSYSLFKYDDEAPATPPPTDAPAQTPEPTMSTTPPTPEPAMPVTPPTPEPTMPDAPPTPTMPVAPPTPEPFTPVAPPTGDDECMVVIIEAESLAVLGDWKIVRDSGASGGEYIVWEGLTPEANNRNAEDGDIISTTVEIATPGTYSFKWLMRQPSGVASDRANDTWLYFPDATRFGPEGTGASYGTFVKVFGNAADGNFKYSGTAEEANHAKSQIAVEFAQAGEYVMQIAGRSHGHEIDQIILFGGKDADGEDVDAEDAAAGCE